MFLAACNDSCLCIPHRSGQATNASTHEGEHISLEPDSLEPAPVSSGGSRLPYPQMGNVRSKSPVIEETEESTSIEQPPPTIIVPSILDQMAQDVPWADDDSSWQSRQADSVQHDETDEAPREAVQEFTSFVDEDGVHYLEDGHFWVEMPGLPPAEESVAPVPQVVTNSEPARGRNRRVRFTTDPIRGL